MALAAIIALLAAADLIVKEWIEHQKPEDFPRPAAKTGGRLWLYRNHNGGFPFGFMKERPELVRGIPMAVISCLGGFLLCLMQSRGHKGQKAGLVLVLGGGLSNLYDRCIRRYVVDYANLRFGFLKKVVFNLGDLFVLAGTVLLMVLELFETGRNKKKMPGKSRRCLS